MNSKSNVRSSSFRDLRDYLDAKKKSQTDKAQDSSRKAYLDPSCRRKMRETIQISLGLIKKPRKVTEAGKKEKVSDETINSNGYDEVVRAEKKNTGPSPAKSCSKEFFPLSKQEGQKSVRIIESSSSRLQQRLQNIRQKTSPIDHETSTQLIEDVKPFVLNPNVAEFQPSSSRSSSSCSTYSSSSNNSNDLTTFVVNEEAKRNALAKLTTDQQLGLLASTELPQKYFQESLEYFIHYYEDLEEYLNVGAVCEFLTLSGIQFTLL